VSSTRHKRDGVAQLSLFRLANLRLILAVEVQAGNHHTSKASAPGLWRLLDGLFAAESPRCCARRWLGNEPVMREAEQGGQPTVQLRLTNGWKRAIESIDEPAGLATMRRRLAGQGGRVAPAGLGPQRLIVDPAGCGPSVRWRLSIADAKGQLALGFAEIVRPRVWEYAVLVTVAELRDLEASASLRDRADWRKRAFRRVEESVGRGGFTTQRSQSAAA